MSPAEIAEALEYWTAYHAGSTPSGESMGRDLTQAAALIRSQGAEVERLANAVAYAREVAEKRRATIDQWARAAGCDCDRCGGNRGGASTGTLDRIAKLRAVADAFRAFHKCGCMLCDGLPFGDCDRYVAAREALRALDDAGGGGT